MKSSCTCTPGYKAAKRLLLALALIITAFAAKAAAVPNLPDHLYFHTRVENWAEVNDIELTQSSTDPNTYTGVFKSSIDLDNNGGQPVRFCYFDNNNTKKFLNIGSSGWPKLGTQTTWDVYGSGKVDTDGKPDHAVVIPYDNEFYHFTVTFTDNITGSGKVGSVTITKTVVYEYFYTQNGTDKPLANNIILIDANPSNNIEIGFKAKSKSDTKYFGPTSNFTYSTDTTIDLSEGNNTKIILPSGDFTYRIVLDKCDGPTKATVTRTAKIIYPKTKYITVNGTKTEYADGEYLFSAGDVISFSGKLSDNSGEPTWGLASDANLAAGKYTLTKNATGKFTAPANADDYVYTLTLIPGEGEQTEWTLTVTSALNTSKISKTLTRALRNFTNTSSYVPTNDDTMWYTGLLPDYNAQNGADEYNLLIGNGSFGACVAGKDGNIEIALNEKGYFQGSVNDVGGQYESLGSIKVNTSNVTSASGAYVQQIDYATGTLAMVSNCTGHKFAVEGIGSYPDQVLAFHFTDSDNKINLTFSGFSTTVENGIGYGSFSKKLDFVTGAVCYAVKATNGSVSSNGSSITVSNADEVCLYIAGANNLNPQKTYELDSSVNLSNLVKTRAYNATQKGWSAIYNSHLEDYQALYSKMNLKLQGQTNNFPTDRLQDGYDNNTLSQGQRRMYEELVFAYGRYLAISSSRPYNRSIGINAPSNLQGIWAQTNFNWHCDIHSDINIQMNYWPNDVTNISETHLPLVKWLIAMSNSPLWKQLATENGATSGWTCKNSLNPFGGATEDFYYHAGGNYFTAQSWLTSHIISHYLFTLDEQFAQEALPTLWGACQFWAPRLVKVTEGNSYVYEAPSEYSPEHGGAENGTAHAQQMLVYLFKYTLELANKYNYNPSNDELTKFEDIYAHLDKGLNIEILGGKECLREWKYSNASSDDNHRHLSHLTCMYPLGQVRPEDERIFNATINAMRQRGLGAGDTDVAVWTTAWKVANWARAASHEDYNQTAANIFSETILYHNYARVGLYRNLTSRNNIMQIEGNFGLTAGVAEMLLQSFRGEITKAENPYGYIDLAPALPKYWPAGEVNGLKAMGNYQVDYTWDGGKIQSATITCLANDPLPFYLHYSDLTSSNYHVANISNMTKEANPTTGWDNAHVWYFTPSAKGASVTIEIGAGEDAQDNDGWQVNFGSSTAAKWQAKYTNQTKYTSTAKFAVTGKYNKADDGVTIDDAITVTCQPGYKFASVAVTSTGTVSVDGANVSGTKAFSPAANSFTLNSTAKITDVLFKLVVDPNYYTAEGATQGTFPEALEGDVEDLAENFLMQDSDDNWFANSIKLYDNIDYKLDKNVTTNAFTYQRELVGDAVANGYWQPLYLPVEVADWSDFASKVIALTGATTTSDGEVLTYTPVTGTLQAHHLYIFMPKANIDLSLSNIVVNSLPTDAATTTVESTNYTYTLTGNYAKKTNMKSSGAYALWDGAFMQAESDEVILKPYRLYLTIASKNGNQAPKRIAIHVVDPEETGIEDLMAEPQEVDDAYYDLMGRKVLNPTTGLYIHNGKKVYIK